MELAVIEKIAALAPCLCPWTSLGTELLPTIFAYTGVTTILLGWVTSTVGDPQRSPAATDCQDAGRRLGPNQ